MSMEDRPSRTELKAIADIFVREAIRTRALEAVHVLGDIAAGLREAKPGQVESSKILIEQALGKPKQQLNLGADSSGVSFVMRLPEKARTVEEWEAECAAYQAGVPGAAETRQLEHTPPDPRQPIEFNGIKTPRGG